MSIVADANEHGVFARYIRGIGLVAREQDNLLQYYLFNAHGDVVQRSDHSGGILKSYDYDAFGVEKNPEKLDSNPFRFCGEYWDSDTQTLYLRARYYDPNIGRFGAEDPVRDGLNWYTYCGNNPLMFVDPLGLAAANYQTASKIATSSPSTAAQMAAKAAINSAYKTATTIAKTSTSTAASEAAKAAVKAGTTTTAKTTNTAAKVATPATTSSSSSSSSKSSTSSSSGSSSSKSSSSSSGSSNSGNSTSSPIDVTIPLDTALEKTVKTAENLARISEVSKVFSSTLGTTIMGRTIAETVSGNLGKGVWFTSQVYHNAPWDIKRPKSWDKIIGEGTFPGIGVSVCYQGNLMTPEELGNYTYGYIGAALDFSLPMLYSGSWAADGFSTGETFRENEFNDWNSITAGYNAYSQR